MGIVSLTGRAFFWSMILPDIADGNEKTPVKYGISPSLSRTISAVRPYVKERFFHQGKKGGISVLGLFVKRGGLFSRNDVTPSRASADLPV